jgi:cytochrome c peroxidase
LHTLEVPPPLETKPAAEDQVKIDAGRKVFLRERCDRCHVPPLTFTSPEAYDVGLADERGQRKFNPPSLRGVSQGTAFFHDGRAKSLEEVFSVHGHPSEKILAEPELSALLRYLNSL